MAKRTVLVDDIDGEDFQGVSTHTFSLDADRYQIDLSPKNLMMLRTALEPFVKAGRHNKKREPRSGSFSSTNGHSGNSSPLLNRAEREELGRQERQSIRAWAEENGYDVKDRGAFSKEVLSAYREATGNVPKSPV